MLHVDDQEFFTKVVDGGTDSQQQYEIGDLDPIDEITAKGLAAVLSVGIVAGRRQCGAAVRAGSG